MSDPSVTILFFANYKDLAGQSQLSLSVPPDCTIAQLRVVLGQAVPSLQPLLGSALFAVNQEFAFDDQLIPPAAEVACFPPVSGGSPTQPATILQITAAELDLNAITDAITLPSTGAVCLFSGIVRAETHRPEFPPQTSYLEYEAYHEMAMAKMAQVAAEIRARWQTVQGIAIVHRVGRMLPGTPTVLIACAAAHRDTGVFAAAQYGIDRLKEIVPIWKREVGPADAAWRVGSYQPISSDLTSHVPVQ
jgi:molybdopterin synthase catalytic subunit/molybdopterin converting factor small subunit